MTNKKKAKKVADNKPSMKKLASKKRMKPAEKPPSKPAKPTRKLKLPAAKANPSTLKAKAAMAIAEKLIGKVDAIHRMKVQIQRCRKTVPIPSQKVVTAALTLIACLKVAPHQWPIIDKTWAIETNNDLERFIDLAERDLLTAEAREYAYNWIFATLVLLGASERLVIS